MERDKFVMIWQGAGAHGKCYPPSNPSKDNGPRMEVKKITIIKNLGHEYGAKCEARRARVEAGRKYYRLIDHWKTLVFF